MTRPATWPADKPWPPHHFSPPTAVGEIQVVGQLQQDAELRFSVGGAWASLVFELHTGKGFPYAVTRPVPAGPDDLQAATTLQRGVSARVSAHGCVFRNDHGLAVLQLLEVTNVTPI